MSSRRRSSRRCFQRFTSASIHVRGNLPGPTLQLLQEGRLLHALPQENRVPQDVLLPVPIEDGRHALAPARPERPLERALPPQAVLRENPLEGLLVFRVGFPIHLEAKPHAPVCTRSGVNNDFVDASPYRDAGRPDASLNRTAENATTS